MYTRIDHLVIAATDIDRGLAYAKQTLGVDLPPGGVHPKMGTHNHLMRLGEALFLEVMAINPDGAAPETPRWYGLDDPSVRARLDRESGFLAWVVNTDDIDALMQRAALSMGRAETLSRGNLRWQFSLPCDGRLLAGGLIPYAIEWEAEEHPAGRMADLGCRLAGMALYHPYPEWLVSVLDSMGAAELVEVHGVGANEVPYMTARITTPFGVRELTSRRR
ncbi:VOC family protein [Pseudodesulfovibrio sediminis]|uniref:Glyoxalase n=1 Tax=Pseudodesulfovibrio sediminis TaxID=2810563 RepID=A0ABM7P7H7_9BACT|nr:VOC family protein [Pseudodesulfovibrio sediminis]BCS88944.1 glyoxalase [Pseudodesulfovibrio sediminis]